MHEGMGLTAIILAMAAAAGIALLIVAPLVIASWAMPLRWCLAWWRCRTEPKAMEKFRARHHQNPATRFRYWMGMLFSLVPLGVTLVALVVVVVIAVVRVTAGLPEAKEFNEQAGVALGVFLVLWFGVQIVLMPLSYVYEFYVLHPTRRVWSFHYFAIFLFNLSFPLLFWFGFLLAQQFGAPAFLEKFVFGATEVAPMVLVNDEMTPCDEKLAALGLRRSSIKEKQMEQSGYPYLWIDRYLRSVTLDVFDPFECTFTDIRNNPHNSTMSMLVMLFRLGVSFFSISVYALLIARLFRLIAPRQHRKGLA